MKVILVGLPLFAKKIQKELSAYDVKNTYVALDTYYSKKDKLLLLWHIWSADVVYSINGTISKSKVFDITLWLGKKLIMQWAGTDVLKAIDNYKRKSANPKFISKVKHFSEAPWLIEELKEVGIEAKQLYFTTFEERNSIKRSKLPDNFTILTYLGNNRADFYGLKHIIALAEALPDVLINVVGENRLNQQLPNNIHMLGWVNDMEQLYNDSVVFIRMTKHDGFPNSVIEALSHGMYVCWNNKYLHTIHTPTSESLIKAVSKLKKDFSRNELNLNVAGQDFVEKEFDSKKVLSNLVKTFTQLL